MAARRPRLAVWKFASCDGCQLSLLDCEDELLAVADAVEIAYFPEATRAMVRGPYDVSLVEGSITTPHDAERIHQVRRSSKKLITIGACASAGGIQALRNFAEVKEYAALVYASPQYLKVLATSTAIADHVTVDYELQGCPVNRHQLLEVIGALLNGRQPVITANPVCVECKMRGIPCVMVARGTPCLGPVTHAGCGALCPSFDRGCFGCYGPSDAPATRQLSAVWTGLGASRRELLRVFRAFNANATAFRREVTRMIARTIRVDYLARVEGEVSLTVKLKGREATDVQLSVFEPPRFFEAFLRGRSMLEVPDITARICGICPVAYQLAGSQAVEDALGVALDADLRTLRRLLMCGEWIESHALHAFMLHAPDFLGYPDGIAMAKDHPERVREGLRIKKAGNALVTAVGGREIHPVNVRVGGFYRAPTRAELLAVLPELRWAQGAAVESLLWMKGFDFPDLDRDYEFVALQAPGEYAMTEGRIVSSKGIDLPIRDYEAEFVEEHVPYSNALFARQRERGAYLCGPLARFNLNGSRLSPPAREAAEQADLAGPMTNPFRSLLVRMVETVEALSEAIRIIEAWQAPSRAFADLPHRAGSGAGCVEAPRGLLFHRYDVAADGTIRSARIIPPTSQNQRIMEEDIYALAPRLADQPLPEATLLAEQAIRNYDPCISCATHYLTLRLERE